MRKLYPDVSQLLRENDVTETEKKDYDRIISALADLPQQDCSREAFRQDLRKKLLAEAGKNNNEEKTNIVPLRKLKPAYWALGAVASILIAVLAVTLTGQPQDKVNHIALDKGSQTPPQQASEIKTEANKSFKNTAVENADTNRRASAKEAAPQDSAQMAQESATGIMSLKMDQADTKALPMLPKIEQEPVGAGGQGINTVKVNLTLKTELPAVPDKMKAYSPVSTPYTIQEVTETASKFGIKGKINETPEEYSLAQGDLYIQYSRTEGLLIYNDLREDKAGNRISKTQAAAAAKSFLERKGITIPGVEMINRDDNKGLYHIRYQTVIEGIKTLSPNSYIDVTFQGRVKTIYYLRYDLGKAYEFPLVTANEAWKNLQKEKITGEPSQANVSINGVELVYYNFPKMGLNTNQSFIQPAYVFRGTGTGGGEFERIAPAIPPQYYQN